MKNIINILKINSFSKGIFCINIFYWVFTYFYFSEHQVGSCMGPIVYLFPGVILSFVSILLLIGQFLLKKINQLEFTIYLLVGFPFVVLLLFLFSSYFE
jgi:hypothetical protein